MLLSGLPITTTVLLFVVLVTDTLVGAERSSYYFTLGCDATLLSYIRATICIKTTYWHQHLPLGRVTAVVFINSVQPPSSDTHARAFML